MVASASERLRAYRAKRDFSITSEPAGTSPPALDGHRFVVQRHRARRLHYDVRLEAAGVLISWAVPKGPTLDPDVRRMAVHVEDHPLDYFDFEGVIPAGEYGGGDVIVWDWGTWAPGRGRRSTGGHRRRQPPRRPPRREAAGPLRAGAAAVVAPWRRGHGRQGLAAAQEARRGRRRRLGPRGPSALGQDGPHQRRGQGRAGGDRGRARPSGPRRPPTSWPRSTRSARRGSGRSASTPCKLTNLDKVLFPGRRRRAAVTKRDLIRHYATSAPVMLPYLADRPVNLHRYPNGVDKPGFWHKAVPAHAPDWIRRWRNDDAGPGETERVRRASTRRPRWPGLANYGAVELHPWTSTVARPAPADVGDDRHRSRRRQHVRRRARPGPPAPHGPRPPRRAGRGQGHRQAGHPDLGARRRRATRSTDTRTGSRPSRGPSGPRCPSSSAGSGRWPSAAGRARLDYTQNADQQDARRAVQRPPGRRARRCRCRSPGTSSTTPISRPDRWTIRDLADRLARHGDPLAPLIGLQQRLPAL